MIKYRSRTINLSTHETIKLNYTK